MTTITNPERISLLRSKISNQQATEAEKNEYMTAMYQNGNITRAQYEKYMKSKDNEIMKLALTIGASVLLGILLGKLLED